MAMLDVGVKVEPGSGVAAAQNYWRSNPAAVASKSAAAKQSGLAA
jgi:hypothetical protein